MDRDEKAAMLYFTAAIPLMLLGLLRSFLRMKRQAVKAEKEFYRTLVANGVPHREAKALAYEYTSVVSLTFWIRQGLMNGKFKTELKVGDDH